MDTIYCKITIVSPGLMFVQKAFFGELIFGGAYYWREFYVSKWVVQLTLTVHGFIFGRAYYPRAFCFCDSGGLYSGGLICGGTYRNFTVCGSEKGSGFEFLHKKWKSLFF